MLHVPAMEMVIIGSQAHITSLLLLSTEEHLVLTPLEMPSTTPESLVVELVHLWFVWVLGVLGPLATAPHVLT
jgi:hypothetical protein